MLNYLLVTFTYVSLICAPSFSIAQDSSSTPDAPQADSDLAIETAPDNVRVDELVDDAAIRQRLTRILNSTEWFQSVNVRVENGVVFLEGTTDNPEAQAWAQQLARRTEDVVAVVNRITILEQQTINFDRASSHVWESLRTLWTDFLERVPLIVVGALVLILTGLFDRVGSILVRRSTQKAHLRPSLQDLMVQLATFATWVAGITIAAVVIFPGMTPAKLLTVLGLGSVALGFAFKDIFENFFAGILILWRFPFDKGDFIECSGIEGRVEDVTIRMSQIRQVDGQLVVVPNAVLFKNPVNILTSLDLRRTTIVCGVAYGEDVDDCRVVIADAVTSCPTVAESKPVEIFATEFADSSINFEATWWTGSTPLDIRRSRDEVVASIKRALDDAGIEIPFPYRTLTFKHPLTVEQSAAIQHLQDEQPETVESETEESAASETQESN